MIDEMTRKRINKLMRQRDEAREQRDRLQADYDALVGKCAELCALCGFTMVDANGEAVS